MLAKIDLESIEAEGKAVSLADKISEVFMEIKPTNTETSISPESQFHGIKNMTSKYLSDLLNVPLQKERAIRTTQALTTLLNMNEKTNEILDEDVEEVEQNRQMYKNSYER